jgi:hypothetical protein
MERKAGIIMRATLHLCAPDTYSGHWREIYS